MGVKRYSEVKHLSQWLLISFAISLFFFLVILPLSSTFQFAFEDGIGGFIEAISSKGAITAFKNSLILATITTFINMGVGTLIAFVITRYKFHGRQVFKALIDLPIAIPTAVVGLSLMMLYGTVTNWSKKQHMKLSTEICT